MTLDGTRLFLSRQDEEEFEDELSVTESFAANHEGAMRRPSLSVARQMFDFFETKQNGQQVRSMLTATLSIHDGSSLDRQYPFADYDSP